MTSSVAAAIDGKSAAALSASPTVFICRDHVVDPMLDEISEKLVQLGVRVKRGPPSVPGRVLDYDPAFLSSMFGDVDVAMFSGRWHCDRVVLEAASRLRGLVNPTIGVETIDLDACASLGIAVGHGAIVENYESMADATVMLMLNLMYNLRASEDVLHGRRPKPPPGPEHALGRLLRTSTIGLVGFGRIGRAVAKRLAGFDAEILAYGPRLRQEDVPAGVRAVELETLYRTSDLIGVFVTINDSSRHLIDEAALAMMKPGVFLVNVARGDAIDEPALIRALKSGHVAAAALDTFAVEPLPLDSPLRTLSNVILTPHMVGHTREVYSALVPAAIENITRLLRGEPPLHWKNPEVASRWRERVEALPS